MEGAGETSIPWLGLPEGCGQGSQCPGSPLPHPGPDMRCLGLWGARPGGGGQGWRPPGAQSTEQTFHRLYLRVFIKCGRFKKKIDKNALLGGGEGEALKVIKETKKQKQKDKR